MKSIKEKVFEEYHKTEHWKEIKNFTIKFITEIK